MTTPGSGYSSTGSNSSGDTFPPSTIPSTTDRTSDSTSSGGVKEQAAQVGGLAKEHAAEVTGTAKTAATDVVSTAKDQVSTTVDTVKTQVQQVASEARTQVTQQAAQQQQKAAGSISTFAQGFLDLADGKDASGPAQDLVREVGSRLQGIATFVENKEPAELLSDVRTYAQRSPGIFLFGAVGVGFVIARFVKGAKEASSTDTGTGSYTTPLASEASFGGTPTGYAASSSADTAAIPLGAPLPDPLAVPSPSWAQEQREGAYRG